MKRILLRWILFLLAANVASCNNEEDVRTKSSGQQAVFFDYSITGEEQKTEVTCLFQFKKGGSNGPSIKLLSPAKVEIDGKPLEADSAGLSGTFYELIQPMEDFKGHHTIVFTDAKGNQQAEEFEFRPFYLLSELTQQVSKKPFTIKFTGLPKQSHLRLILADTAFATNDVNEIVNVENGALRVTQSMLDRLTPGPVHLEVFEETEKTVLGEFHQAGRIWISYGLKRDFELKD